MTKDKLNAEKLWYRGILNRKSKDSEATQNSIIKVTNLILIVIILLISYVTIYLIFNYNDIEFKQAYHIAVISICIILMVYALIRLRKSV